MIPPVVAVLLVAVVPAVLFLGFLGAMTIVVGALPRSTPRTRGCCEAESRASRPRDQSLRRGPAARMSSAVPSA
jgi:hypothetical protein